MSLYQVAQYLHVVGAMGLFLTLGLEWTSVVRLRSAAARQEARAWLSLLTVGRRIGPATLAAILVPGAYMAVVVWGGVCVARLGPSAAAAEVRLKYWTSAVEPQRPTPNLASGGLA